MSINILSILATGGSNQAPVPNMYSVGSNGAGQNGLGEDNANNALDITNIGAANSWERSKSGIAYSFALRNNQTLWAWGNGGSGRTGLGVVTNQTTPMQIGTSSWIDVDGGIDHSMGVMSNGTLWSWGNNEVGKTGRNTAVGIASVPTQVGVLTVWSKVACGQNHSLMLRTNGTLWSCGSNQTGRTGLNTTTGNALVPTQVGSASDWAQIECSTSNGFAIKTNGTLWSWGANSNGVNGNNATAGNVLVPTQIGVDTWTMVSAALDTTNATTTSHVLAIRTDGTLWTWGQNANGKTGLGVTTGNTLVPTQVGVDSDWVWVSAAHFHSMAVKSDGTLWAWGQNSSGKTGLGVTTGNTLVPTQVGLDTDWSKVSLSSQCSIMIK